MFLHKIISGGQTGADRAGLDAALELGIPIGGHLPKGRRDETGQPLPPDAYPHMEEADSDKPAVRTELNVRNADATVVFSHGLLEGGSKLTAQLCQRHAKPCLHVDLARHDLQAAVRLVTAWLAVTQPAVLNVAGTRASNDPAIYAKVRFVLTTVLKLEPYGP